MCGCMKNLAAQQDQVAQAAIAAARREADERAAAQNPGPQPVAR